MTAAPPPGRIGQIAIRVHDLARATDFYRDVLGLTFLFEIPGAAFFAIGDVRLMLSLPEKPEFDHPSSIIYYDVPDIKGSHRDIVGQGAACEREPHLLARMPDHELWMSFYRDSEGNLFALMSELRE